MSRSCDELIVEIHGISIRGTAAATPTGIDEPGRFFSDTCEGSNAAVSPFPCMSFAFSIVVMNASKIQTLNLAPRMIKGGQLDIFEVFPTINRLSPFRRIHIQVSFERY